VNGYCVTIDVQAKATEQGIEELAESLGPLHGSLSVGEAGWSAIVTVDATDLDAAREHAVTEVLRLARQAGFPTSPVVRVETVREDVRDAELEVPNYPDLVSGPEVAELLGVTRQRVHQLAADHPDFPTPLYRLGVGSLWVRAGIEKFAKSWERKPGRPRKVATPAR
jgi:predicted DNA-binding transcriptional regulator AlpA